MTSLSKVLRLPSNVACEVERRKIPAHSVVTDEERAQLDNFDSESSMDNGPDDLALNEARSQAERLLADARAEAQRLVAQATAEADGIRKAAHEAGYQAGYEAGVDQAKREMEVDMERHMQQVQAVMEQAQAHRRQLIQSMGMPLVQICMTAVKELLKRELVSKPADIEHMVMDILAAVAECTKAEVRVHPNDYPLAVEANPAWHSVRLGTWEVAVVPDISIEPGGCEVRWDTGRADARVETKLDMLETTLAAFFERSVSEHVAAILA
jgi:flagellar assembly protein FliH